MITLDEYLALCDQALDEYANICGQLGDDLVNDRLDGVSGSNSAFALVAHVVGVMTHWGRTVNRGVVVPRDRDAEFRATGSAAQALELLDAGRARLHEDARSASPDSPPADRVVESDGSIPYATQGAVLLHVYEELAQHLGQLEVTRDVLLSRR